MNSLVINMFIVLLHLCILVNQTTATELGEVSCRYSGLFDSGNQICHKDVVKLNKLPEDCKSFVFDGVVCDKDNNIMPNKLHGDLEQLKSLIEFDDKSHPVFLFYTHGSLEDWAKAFFSDYATEAQKVQDFIGEYTVKGLILRDIITPQLYLDQNFYELFPAYIKAIKNKIPDLEIGFYLSAIELVNSVNKGAKSHWFDFSKINGIVDFFLFELDTFNKCTNDFLRGGITPYDSTDPNIMTLTKFGDALTKSNIEKDKVFLELLISPIPKPEVKYKFNPCEISYNEYCENVDDYRSMWCIDDNKILYQKGEFAKKFSKGFVARDIDLVDRDNKCGCDKYITFNMLLRGYKGEVALTCNAFDG